MQYRDYFSLKTLSRFSVDPDLPLPESETAEDMKRSILAVFGTVGREDAEFLSHKTDCALRDLRVLEDVRAVEPMEIPELDDTPSTRVLHEPSQNRVPTKERGRELS